VTLLTAARYALTLVLLIGVTLGSRVALVGVVAAVVLVEVQLRLHNRQARDGEAWRLRALHAEIAHDDGKGERAEAVARLAPWLQHDTRCLVHYGSGTCNCGLAFVVRALKEP
jgi:hypothetical protein